MGPNLLEWLKKVFHSNSYSSELESYIIAGDPKFPADVERLTTEFCHRQTKTFYGL